MSFRDDSGLTDWEIAHIYDDYKPTSMITKLGHYYYKPEPLVLPEIEEIKLTAYQIRMGAIVELRQWSRGHDEDVWAYRYYKRNLCKLTTDEILELAKKLKRYEMWHYPADAWKREFGTDKPARWDAE